MSAQQTYSSPLHHSTSANISLTLSTRLALCQQYILSFSIYQKAILNIYTASSCWIRKATVAVPWLMHKLSTPLFHFRTLFFSSHCKLYETSGSLATRVLRNLNVWLPRKHCHVGMLFVSLLMSRQILFFFFLLIIISRKSKEVCPYENGSITR